MKQGKEEGRERMKERKIGKGKGERKKMGGNK